MDFYIGYYLAIIMLMCIGYAFKAKLFDYVILFIIIFISGFRYEVGYDHFNYYSMFIGNSLELEPLFMVVITLARNLWDNTQYTYLLFSFVTIVVMFIAITKYTKYYRTAFLYYLLIPGLYLNTFSIIRQGIAISFFFLGVYYLVYLNEKKKYFLFGTIGFLFHFSVIVPMLLIYILRKWLKQKHSFYFQLFLICIALVLSFSGILSTVISLIGGRYSVYGSLVDEQPVLKTMILCSYSIFILYAYRKNTNPYLNTLLNLQQLGILITIAFSEFTPVTRLAYYFLIFQIIIVPHLIYNYRDHTLRLTMLILFTTYYLGLQINALVVDESLDTYPKMTPYNNYFIVEK